MRFRWDIARTLSSFVARAFGLLVILGSIRGFRGRTRGFGAAVHARKYFWAAAFFSLGVLFNPMLPVMLSRNIFLLLGLASLVLFTLSLAALKPAHRLSVASITDRRALKSESL